MEIVKTNRDSYLEGLDSYIDLLEGVEADEQVDKKPTKEEYKRAIQVEAARRTAVWKLRKKSEKPRGQSVPKPKTETTKSTLPKTKVDHGPAPKSPDGYENYWYEPKK
jgi:hypothetical protein